MKVPVVTGPSVDQSPLRAPEVRVVAGPGTFGAFVGQGLQDVGGVAQGIVMEQKRDADSRKIVELAGIATDINNGTLSDLQKKQMLEAKGVTESAAMAFEKTKADAMALAENETQKDILNRTLTQQSVAMTQSARAHEAQQLEAYDNFSSDQVVEASKQSVTIDPLNKELADISKMNASAAVNKRWQGKVDSGQLTQLRDAAVSGITARQLETLLANGRNADFLVLYPQVKGELRGADADKMAKVATHTSDTNVEQALTDAIYAKHPDDEIGAINEANAMLEGERQDNVTNRLKVRFGEIATAAKASEQADLDRMGEAYVNGGYKLAAVPSDVLSRVKQHNPTAVIALRDHELQTSNRTAVIRTDPVSWSRWAYSTPSQKLDPKNDPINWRNVWNESDYQHAVAVKAALLAERGGFTKAAQRPTYTQADINKLVTDEFTKAYGTTKDHQAKKFAAFDGLLRQRIEHYQAQNDGKMPPYEGPNSISAFVGYALAEGARVDAGMWGDKAGRRFQAILNKEEFRPNDPTLSQRDPLDVVATVPDDIAAKIADDLNSKGVTPTDEMILNIYRRSLEKR